MPIDYKIIIDGTVIDVEANGRAKSVKAAVEKIYGAGTASDVTFSKFVTGGVAYRVTVKDVGVIEAIVQSHPGATW